MQTSNTAESTAQTSSDFKRCSGSAYPGDKSRRLIEPHITEIINFAKDANKPDGLSYKCRTCQSAYILEQKNLPKIDPPEFMTCRVCKESKHHSEMRNNAGSRNGKANICGGCAKKLSSDRYADKPETYTAYNTLWRAENPHKRSAQARRETQRRRALKAQAFVEDVQPTKLLELYGNRCFLVCGRDVTNLPKTWHVEHVIPLSRGGEHSYENTRVACADCNLSKGTKTYWEVVVGTESGWPNFTVSNLYLFNENAEWHYEQILKTAREAANKTSKENK